MSDDWLATKLSNWWLNSAWWIRVGVGLVLMGLGLYWTLSMIFWPGEGSIVSGRGFLGAVLTLGFGLALTVAGGRSQSERNGYHF